MGSYICVGLVTNGRETHDFLKLCKKVFSVYQTSIQKLTLKYPLDDECLNWCKRTVTFQEIDSVLSDCYSNNLCEMNINYSMGQRSVEGILFHIKKEIDYQGILFEIPEDNFDIINEIDVLEDQIKLLIKDFLNLGFEYGFCDSEADIEFSKAEIMSMNSKYSILLINTQSNNPIIKLAPWRIDGLTSRT